MEGTIVKVERNIGIINALIRITLGFTFLSWYTAKLQKRPWQDSYLIMIMLAAMKIAEGILQYCPVTDLMKNGSQTNGNGTIKNMIDTFITKEETNDAPNQQQANETL